MEIFPYKQFHFVNFSSHYGSNKSLRYFIVAPLWPIRLIKGIISITSSFHLKLWVYEFSECLKYGKTLNGILNVFSPFRIQFFSCVCFYEVGYLHSTIDIEIHALMRRFSELHYSSQKKIERTKKENKFSLII